MGISEDIKQSKFKSAYSKAIINILYTQSWLNDRHNMVFKKSDVTTPQFNILRILRGQYPNPSTVNLLIDRMIDKSSNASRIVDRLEQKELVERRQCKNDRRAVDVFISEKGLQLLERLDQELDEMQANINKLSDDELEQLNDLLDRFRATSQTVSQ